MKAATALLVALLLLAGCASDNKPKPEPPPATPRVGTVALVSEVKTRGMTSENWASTVKGVYFNDGTGGIMRIHYEVTVLYEDHTQGTVILPERPDLRAGQKVRVTGDKIEPLSK